MELLRGRNFDFLIFVFCKPSAEQTSNRDNLLPACEVKVTSISPISQVRTPWPGEVKKSRPSSPA